MKRRKAIKNSMLGLGAVSLLSSFDTMKTLLKGTKASGSVGIQLFTIPFLADNDFRGTLQLLAETGYKEIELFGPYPFSPQATKEGWVQMQEMLNLKQHAFYGLTAQETATVLKENDLTVPSVHTTIVTMRQGLNAFLDGMTPISPKYAVVPALLDPNDRNSADSYKRLADEFNRFGETMKPYGMQFVYHNHGYEHIEYEGEMGLDILINNTNPEFVQFELDIFWMKAAGKDPISYLKKYPDRFKLMHVKDASVAFRFKGDGATPDQWMEGFPLMSDPGDGVFDIPKILEQGSASGVEHFFLERDLAPEPEQTIKNSYVYLSKWI